LSNFVESLNTLVIAGIPSEYLISQAERKIGSLEAGAADHGGAADRAAQEISALRSFITREEDAVRKGAVVASFH
jgi:hypothetical protein